MTPSLIEYESQLAPPKSLFRRIYRRFFGVGAIGFGGLLVSGGVATAFVALFNPIDRGWTVLFSAASLLIGGLMLSEGIKAFRRRG